MLQVNVLREEVTVTAARQPVEESGAPAQPVNIIDSEEIAKRVKTVVAQAVEGEAGVHLQRTSPTMAGIFVRGLTGNKVNVFVDGVRYSNGAQRGGVNTFLDLIEPGALETIEVLRGPSSAQYGSDALGGSVQFLTKPPRLGVAGGPRWAARPVRASARRSGTAADRRSFCIWAHRRRCRIASGPRVGLVEARGRIDSHAAVTRFLGVTSDELMDDRLPDTGFYQIGGSVRAQWAPSAASASVR